MAEPLTPQEEIAFRKHWDSIVVPSPGTGGERAPGSFQSTIGSRPRGEPEPVEAEPTDEQIRSFRKAWNEANDRGDHGHRVYAGLRAALHVDAERDKAVNREEIAERYDAFTLANYGHVLGSKERDLLIEGAIDIVTESVKAQAWDEGVIYAYTFLLESFREKKALLPGRIMYTDTKPIFAAIDESDSRLTHQEYNAHIASTALSSAYGWLSEGLDDDALPNPYRDIVDVDDRPELTGCERWVGRISGRERCAYHGGYWPCDGEGWR